MTASQAAGTLNRVLASLSPDELRLLLNDFQIWARDDQLPPAQAQGGGEWTAWLMLGGRGAGKTRAGAEWVRALVRQSESGEPLRIALVGETFADARSVMMEGVSGLLAVHPPGIRPVFEPSKRQLTWPNGAMAQLFSAEDGRRQNGQAVGPAGRGRIGAPSMR